MGFVSIDTSQSSFPPFSYLSALLALQSPTRDHTQLRRDLDRRSPSSSSFHCRHGQRRSTVHHRKAYSLWLGGHLSPGIRAWIASTAPAASPGTVTRPCASRVSLSLARGIDSHCSSVSVSLDCLLEACSMSFCKVR